MADDSIIEPDLPASQLPEPPKIAGNVPDPDAAVLDSLVEQYAAPPTPHQQPVSRPLPVVEPSPITRLLTGSLVVAAGAAGWQATMLVPADPSRVSIRITAVSATATDIIRIADDPSKVQFLSSSAQLGVNTAANGNPFELSGFTGPLYVYSPDGVGPITVSFAAVTR